MKRLLSAALAASLAFAAASVPGRDAARRQPGRRAVDGPALAERDRCSSASPATSTSRWSARQGPGPGAGAGHQVEADLARPSGASSCARACKFHDGTPFTADDVVFTLQARRRRRLRHEELHQRRSRKCARSTTTRSRSRPRRRSRSCPTCSRTSTMMSKKWCEDNKADDAGRPPQGHREHRHRSRPTAPARIRLRERQPSVRTVLVRNGNYWGKIDGNVDEVIFTPIGNDADARRGAAVGRDRRDGAGAAAGHRAHQAGRQRHGAAGPRAAHHLPRHGPEARRAAVSPASRARTRSRTSACARPSTRRSTSRRIKSTRDARRLHARPALMVGARHQRLPARHEQAPAVRRRGRQEAAGRGRLPERLRGRR